MEEQSSSIGSLRRRRDPPPEEEEIEEGGIRRGEEEEGMHPACKRRRLEEFLADTRGALALPSPTPSSGSEGTISDHSDRISAGAAAPAPVAREAFPCHFCDKEFGSRKAVNGHMRVHQAEKEKEPSLNLALSWASTGKRGCNGNGRAVTVPFAPKEEVVDDTRAIVLAVAQPQPMAAAVARTYPEPIHDDPSAVMVAEANPPNLVVDNRHLPAAAPYVGAHHHAPPQPAAATVQHLALPPETAQGGPYRCKFPGCNMEYKTHQGLGGHVAGHINREKLAAAAAAQGSSGAGLGARPVDRHPCRVCGQEFLTGVALGGHMRKHYEGKVIVNKKKHRHDDLDLTLSLAPPGQVAATTPAPAPAIAAAALPPAEAKTEAAEHGAEPEPEPEPTPAPVPAPPPTSGVRRNVVRIFGVDIEKPADAEEQDGGSD